jgi:hypothetical protein
MRTTTELTLYIEDSDPYLNIDCTPYGPKVTVISSAGENRDSVILQFPRGDDAKAKLHRACLTCLMALRYRKGEHDEQYAIRFLEEAISDLNRALRDLRPEEVTAD